MNDQTKSEILFEQFCRENQIKYQRVEEKEYRTSDYVVYLGEHRVIAEVKQCDSSKKDREQRRKLRIHGHTSYWEESGRRIRDKIRSARKQLKAESRGECPAILILYDNVSIGSIDPDDIKTAMYGHESVNIDVPVDPRLGDEVLIVDQGFGSGRKFTESDNTTFSAIALLFRFGGDLRLSVFHNVFAKNPIDPTWLRRDTVKHFTLEPEIREWPEWRAI